MTMTNSNIFSQRNGVNVPEKRHDVENYDAGRISNAGPDDPAPDSDSSADTKQADGVTGQPPAFGPAVVAAPKVATAVSKGVVVQHPASHSMVKP